MRSRVGTVLVAMAMVASAALAGMVVGEVTDADAIVDSGSRPVVIPMDPTRILDTRPAPDGPIGVSEPGKLLAQQTMFVDAAGTRGIPADAVAVQLNVTTTNATDESFLTLFARGTSRPLASTMNPDEGDTSFNGALIRTGVQGDIAVYNHVGSVDVIIDVTGYLVEHTHDDRYYTKNQANNRFMADRRVSVVAAGQVSLPGNLVDISGPVQSASRPTTGEYRINFRNDLITQPNGPRLIVGVDAVSADAQTQCHWDYDGNSLDSILVYCGDENGAENSHFSFIIHRLAAD